MEVTIRPMVLVRFVWRLCAIALGVYFISRAIRWMRSRTPVLINGLLRSARETVECETPDARAISSIDTSCLRITSPFSWLR